MPDSAGWKPKPKPRSINAPHKRGASPQIKARGAGVYPDFDLPNPPKQLRYLLHDMEKLKAEMPSYNDIDALTKWAYERERLQFWIDLERSKRQ